MPKSFLNMPGYPLGLRNNNPGNIRTGDNWQGMIGANQGFVVFQDLSWGLRALGIDLANKIGNGYNTIQKIITRYAPTADNNDTAAYIGQMESLTGISRSKILTATNDTLLRLIRGIIHVENGSPYYTLITDSDINEGLSLIPGGLTTGQAATGVGIAGALFLFSIFLLATTPKLPKLK